MDNNDDELVSTRAKIYTDKPSYQPADDTSSSSSFTPRTVSTSSLSPGAALPADLTSPSKNASHYRINTVRCSEYEFRVC